jgi:hypothetical protein
MNTIRFIVGILILLTILLVFRFFTEPSAFNAITPPILEALGVLMAGLIWGVLLWTLFRLIKGPDKSPNLPNFSFYTAIIFITLYMAHHFIF